MVVNKEAEKGYRKKTNQNKIHGSYLEGGRGKNHEEVTWSSSNSRT